MHPDLLSIFLGFIEGFVLILSPCILSILPIILASSLTGTKIRSFGIIIGFILTFTVFALFARQLVRYSGLDLNIIRYISYGLLFLFALILLSDYLTAQFNRLTAKIAAKGSQWAFFSSANKEKRFISGLMIGSLVALIWTPCAGPILAAVIVQTVIQTTTLISFFTLLAFALGAAIPMLIIILYGLKIRDSVQLFKTKAALIRKILGIIILLNLGYIIAQEQGYVSAPVVTKQPIRTAHYLEKGVWIPYRAPKIEGIVTWLNSPPLHLADLKGKVVLIDFWTYSCINCIRTLPYLNSWYKTYHDKGLVIIGVHTPEFDFEKNVSNVASAVRANGIQYPVALDSLFVTWQNFSNHYWPAHYLINKEGEVVYEHFGEGEYEVTENNIRFLLGIDKTNKPAQFENPSSAYGITPETYLGYGRANTALSPNLTPNQAYDYHFSNQLSMNAWTLQGVWQANEDNIRSMQPNASIKIHFQARKVFVVMGNHTSKPIKMKVLLNGKELTAGSGRDVVSSQIVVNKYSLYEIVVLPEMGDGLLQLDSSEPGVELYTVTFGD